jgi:hypothetical protein
MKIKYTEGYKYQLAEDYIVMTPIKGVTITDFYFTLERSGRLTGKKGYSWDGASGPTFDTKSSISPSLGHDIFCQMMRDGRLSYTDWQDTVNEFFRQQCIKAGMWKWRAAIWHAGVEFGNAGDPSQGPDRQILEAP